MKIIGFKILPSSEILYESNTQSLFYWKLRCNSFYRATGSGFYRPSQVVDALYVIFINSFHFSSNCFNFALKK